MDYGDGRASEDGGGGGGNDRKRRDWREVGSKIPERLPPPAYFPFSA